MPGMGATGQHPSLTYFRNVLGSKPSFSAASRPFKIGLCFDFVAMGEAIAPALRIGQARFPHFVAFFPCACF